MRFEKREKKKVLQKVNSGQSRQEACALPSTPLKMMINENLFLVLSVPITRWGPELV